MRERHHWMWAIYASCSLALLGVLAWVSSATLSLESREREARADARRQELSRQALWRMDSALAPILAREAARPYFHYQPFYAADRAYTSMLEEVRPGEVLVPSPLLQAPEKFVKLHFQISPRGEFTSPQAPTGEFKNLAKTLTDQPSLASDAEVELGELRLIWAVAGKPMLARQQSDSPTGSLGGVFDKNAGVAPGATPINQNDDAQVQLSTGESVSPLSEAREQSSGAGHDAEKPGRADYQARRQVADQALQSVQNNALLPKQATRNDRDRLASADELTKRKEASTSARSGEKPAASEPAPAERSLVDKGEHGVNTANSDKSAAPSTAAINEKPSDLAAGTVTDASRDLAKKDSNEPVLSAKERRGEHVRVPVPVGAIMDRDAAIGTPVPVVHGPFTARWLLGEYGRRELTLVREVSVGDERFTQGVWLDWEQLRPWLLEQTKDLVPSADLRPITVGGEEDPRRLLASIPAELDIGTLVDVRTGRWSPMMTTIIVAWLASLAAVVAVGLVLRSAAELATRRGRFVSAVTHELRTPLTTLCMYSQMLEGGMVGEESKREYLGSLRRESERLARIVENVLEFARLGGRRRERGNDRADLRSLLTRVGESLRARVASAGMGLKIEIDDGVDAAMLADQITVERIVTNLVENACKYGASPAGVVTLRGAVRGGNALIEVSDEGVGIPPQDRERVFEPFERGHGLETETKQGLGLGLPLARGLARELGGDLRLLDRGGGATFQLSVPVA